MSMRPYENQPGDDPVYELAGHEGQVSEVLWTPDGRLAVTAARDGSVRVWNHPSGTLRSEFKTEHSDVYALTVTRDGRLALAATGDGAVYVWDLVTGRPVQRFAAGSEPVFAVAALPDSRRAAVGSASGAISLWDLEAGKLLEIQTSQHDRSIYALAITPDGSIVSASADRSIGVWNPAAPQPRLQLRGHGGAVYALAVSPDGEHLLSGSVDGTVRLWRLADGALLRCVEGHTAAVQAIAISATGDFVASKSADGTVRLYDATNWRLLDVQPEEPGRFPAGLAFHPQQLLLASTSTDRRVRVLELAPEQYDAGTQSRAVTRYVGAKVVLVGDPQAGKFRAAHQWTRGECADSACAHGWNVGLLHRENLKVAGTIPEVRDTWLWVLSGAPDFRHLSPLHLRDASAVLLLLPAGTISEAAAILGAWDSRLRPSAGSALPADLRRLLLVGGDPIPNGEYLEQLRHLAKNHGFEEPVPLHEPQGEPLQAVLGPSIDWAALPSANSFKLLMEVDQFLRSRRTTGAVLGTVDELFALFITASKLPLPQRAAFEACVDRLEASGVIRRLPLGRQILLKPELLDFYSLALLRAAAADPHGLGTVCEDVAISEQFLDRLNEPDLERDLRHLAMLGTIRDLMRQQIIRREPTARGTALIFPDLVAAGSGTRVSPDRTVIFECDGALREVYRALLVQLTYSNQYGLRDRWSDGALFATFSNEELVIDVVESSVGPGQLILGRPSSTSWTTFAQFAYFVQEHLIQRMGPDGFELVEGCPGCWAIVPADLRVHMRVNSDFEIRCKKCGTQLN